MPSEVSGRAFLGLIRYVKDSRGEEVLRRVIDSTGPQTRATFAEPIRILKWYPYPAYVSFLRALERELGGGDWTFCRQLGAVAGERDLGTIFKVFRALASAERLIRACERIWPSYYRDAGRMEATAWSPELTTLRIHDFPEMHRSHCRLMEGWMISTMDQIGFTVNDDARETQCMSEGGPFHEFQCSWTKKA